MYLNFTTSLSQTFLEAEKFSMIFYKFTHMFT